MKGGSCSRKIALQSSKKEIEKNNALAETVYANYQIIEELFSVLNGARAKGYSWDEIRSILKQAKRPFLQPRQLLILTRKPEL